jgi:5'-nucleotidase
MKRYGWTFAVLVTVALGLPARGAERRPHILLSNDDGIAAPGLAAVFAELSRVGDVTVAAPAENQSGMGHGITYAEPIMMREIEPLVKVEGATGKWYRIAAKPATCVRLALAALLTERPDLVVSGINRGDNAGLTLYVSGTLGAAREAAFDGIPAIATSQAQVGSQPMDYRPGAAFIGRLAAEVLKRGMPRGVFLSVNVPAAEIKGVRVVPHKMDGGVTQYDRRRSPAGETYFWNVWVEPEDPETSTDVGAVRHGFVAVTPLRVEVNDEAARAALERWDLK